VAAGRRRVPLASKLINQAYRHSPSWSARTIENPVRRNGKKRFITDFRERRGNIEEEVVVVSLAVGHVLKDPDLLLIPSRNPVCSGWWQCARIPASRAFRRMADVTRAGMRLRTAQPQHSVHARGAAPM
jgi:hypothetical protein